MSHCHQISEVWFDRYLSAHGYRFEVEPDLGITKRPDRLIERDGLRAVCEVKQFDEDPLASMPKDRAVWLPDEHKPVRAAVKRAADQLRPLQEHGLPLVVVLANPHGHHVSLSTRQVIHALYGDDTLQFTVYVGEGSPPDGFNANPKLIAGRNGQIRQVAQYLSAVVLLRKEFNGEDFCDNESPGCAYWVEVICTISEMAVPLPSHLFDGPRDTRWAFNREREVMEQLK